MGTLRKALASRSVVIGGCLLLVVLVVLGAIFADQLTPYDPIRMVVRDRFEAPSLDHWLGTDDGGRDELLRLMIGGQISLLVGLLATVIGGTIGLIVGVISGYFGGRTDAILMRFTDGMIALPLLPLLIVLGAIDLTKLGFSAEFAHSGAAGFWRIVIIISIVDWTGIARIVRAATLAVKELDYVRAARASGAGAARPGMSSAPIAEAAKVSFAASSSRATSAPSAGTPFSSAIWIA